MDEEVEHLSDWYADLVSARYLELGTGMVLGYPLKRLQSGLKLVEPATVYAFSSAVAMRKDDGDELLYDVRTKKLPDGTYELVGKIFHSTSLVKFKGTKEEVGHNFLIITNSSRDVTAMLSQRANWEKSDSSLPNQYRLKKRY